MTFALDNLRSAASASSLAPPSHRGGSAPRRSQHPDLRVPVDAPPETARPTTDSNPASTNHAGGRDAGRVPNSPHAAGAPPLAPSVGRAGTPIHSGSCGNDRTGPANTLTCELCRDTIDERATVVLVNGCMPCHRGCAGGLDPEWEDAESPYCRDCLMDADHDSILYGYCLYCGGRLR